MIVPLERVIYGEYVRGWCKLPYPKHPNGCSMYGLRPDCPPEAPMFDKVIEAPYFLVIQEFDLEIQEEEMKRRHPEWSRKMCRNPRYWQKGLLKRLMLEAQEFLLQNPISNALILKRPEANGVNLFSTCRIHGIKLERNPQKIVKKMVIIGKRRNRKFYIL